MQPSVNWTTKASAESMGVASTTLPCHIFAIHAKIVTALGIETVMLAAEKNVIDSCDMPVENMWCTHTPNPTSPVITVESATRPCPIIGRRENVGTIIADMPVAGKQMMYTHGCPNTQNRCCQSIGSPPRVASKKTNCQWRSSSSRPSATVSAGIEK